MEAETLTMRAGGVKIELYDQPHLEVLVDKITESGAIDPVPEKMMSSGYWPSVFSDESDQSEKEKSPENSLPVPDPVYFNNANSSLYTPTGPIGITISTSGVVQQIYLNKIFLMPENHEFYCPNCNVSVDKVLFCETRKSVDRSAPIQPSPGAGPWSVPPQPQPHPHPHPSLPPQSEPEPQPPLPIEPVRCSECFGYLVQKGKDFFRGLTSCIPGGSDVTADPVIAESRKGLEILKSIVYGGLAQILASLGVVTSAASADASTLDILSLGVANLVGGLFVLAHNLRDLKASKPIEGGNETAAAEDKYYELLGRRENYVLHSFFAILSFLIFGLVPPVVYGFSFRESNDKDLKLAAVAGASVICIALLAAAKAYTERTNSYMTYFKTITFYVTSGVLASLLTYTAGNLVKRLVEQLGWSEAGSESGPNSILSLPQMSVEKPRLGFY